MKFLTLEMHCDPTSRNANSDTALHLAVVNGHLDIIKFFISERNCDPNTPGQQDKIPLHYAAEFGHLHIVKYLIDEQGCNPSCLDKERCSPLHYAAAFGRINTVKFLTVIKHLTPYELATSRNHSDTAQYLQKQSVIHTALAMMKQLGFLK